MSVALQKNSKPKGTPNTLQLSQRGTRSTLVTSDVSKEGTPPTKSLQKSLPPRKEGNKKKTSKKDEAPQVSNEEIKKKIDKKMDIHKEKSEDEDITSTDDEEDEDGLKKKELKMQAEGMKEYVKHALTEQAKTGYERSTAAEVAMRSIIYFQALQQRCTRIPVSTSAEIDACMSVVVDSILEMESRYQACKVRCELLEILCKQPTVATEETREEKQGQAETTKEKQVTGTPRRYADALKMATSTVILQSKEEERSAEDITKQIQETLEVCPDGVRKIKKIRNGIQLICENAAEAQKVKEKIASNEEVNATVNITSASVKKKKIIIFNVPRTETEDTIKKKLKKNLGLGEDFRDDIITLHKQVGVRDNAAHQPVLLPEPLADSLLRGRTVCLGFRDCPIKAYINVTRCHKCLDYDHVAKHCKERQRCTKCSGPHLYTECTARKSCCMACYKYNEKTRYWRRKPRETDHEATAQECRTRYVLLRARQLQAERGMPLATYEDILTGRVSISTYGGKDILETRTRQQLEAYRQQDQKRGHVNGRTR